jgi:hypothetical protein
MRSRHGVDLIGMAFKRADRIAMIQIRDRRQRPWLSASDPGKRPPLRDETPLVVPLAVLVCAPPLEKAVFGSVMSAFEVAFLHFVRFGTKPGRTLARARSIVLPFQFAFAFKTIRARMGIFQQRYVKRHEIITTDTIPNPEDRARHRASPYGPKVPYTNHLGLA